MDFAEIKRSFTALTVEQCQSFADLGISEDRISQQNEKRRQAIEETINRLIPAQPNAHACTQSRNNRTIFEQIYEICTDVARSVWSCAHQEDVPEDVTEDDTEDVTEDVTELNIVLLGKTGAGKHEIGNLILGERKFKAPTSCTNTIEIHENRVDGIKIRIADTPGTPIFTLLDEHALVTEIHKAGMKDIHAFILVDNLENLCYTEDEMQTFRKMKGSRSHSMLEHCIVLFTHANKILDEETTRDMTIKEYLDHSENQSQGNSDQESYKAIKSKLESIDHRVVAVETVVKCQYEESLQRERLIALIKSVVKNANDRTYCYKPSKTEIYILFGIAFGVIFLAAFCYIVIPAETLQFIYNNKGPLLRALVEEVLRA